MITQQELLHTLALQKHTSIYLGNNISHAVKTEKQKHKQNLVKKQKQQDQKEQNPQESINTIKKQLKTITTLNPESAFKSLNSTSSESRQEIIKYIKSHPLSLESKAQKPSSIHPFQRLQNTLSFQSYSQQLNRQEQEQKKLIAQYYKTKKEKLHLPKPIIETTSVLVPSYLQSLIQDIYHIHLKKKKLKINFYAYKQLSVLEQIIQLNNKKLKPLLNLYISKIMGVNITEQTQTEELEVIMMLGMSEKTFEGRNKRELVEILVKNLREIATEEREYQLECGKREGNQERHEKDRDRERDIETEQKEKKKKRF